MLQTPGIQISCKVLCRRLGRRQTSVLATSNIFEQRLTFITNIHHNHCTYTIIIIIVFIIIVIISSWLLSSCFVATWYSSILQTTIARYYQYPSLLSDTYPSAVAGLLCPLHAGICFLLCCDHFPSMTPWDPARRHFDIHFHNLLAQHITAGISHQTCTVAGSNAVVSHFEWVEKYKWRLQSMLSSTPWCFKVFCVCFFSVTMTNSTLSKFLEYERAPWPACDQAVRFTQCIDLW